VPADKLHRLPVTYQLNSTTGALDVWDPAGPESFFAKPPGFAGAHGGLVSTADDYLAFVSFLLGGGRAGGIPALLRRVGELGITFRDLNTRQSPLEEIFVNLIHEPAAARSGPSQPTHAEARR
jgi:CubicO group peptidase (beta-lactamase class C family)